MIYLIWSFEHNAWWGPGRSGYTQDINEAGSYSGRAAEAICLQTNLVAINEAIVPLPDNRSRAKLPTGTTGGRR